MKRAMRAAAGLAAVWAILGTATAAVKPTEKTVSLPPSWAAVEPAQRLAAVRVAELDATRLLMERIYGLELGSDTHISDFALQSDNVRAAVARCIAGVTTSEAPEFKADGTVQVIRAVKLRQVLETVTTTIKETPRLLGTKTEVSVNVSQTNKDTVIDVMGNGAIPGSDGMRKIQAKRAAELDAYRKLAERIGGAQVSSSSTVKDFILQSDEVRARVASQIVRGAKPTKIDYVNDGTCEVTMEIKLADIYRVVKVYSKTWPTRTENEVKVEEEIKTRTFSETGMGASRPKPAGAQTGVAAAAAAAGPQTSYEVVSKTLVGQGVVIE